MRVGRSRDATGPFNPMVAVLRATHGPAKRERKKSDKRTGMDDVHGTHRTAGIVKNPLLLGAQVLGADLLLKFGDNEVDD